MIKAPRDAQGIFQEGPPRHERPGQRGAGLSGGFLAQHLVHGLGGHRIGAAARPSGAGQDMFQRVFQRGQLLVDKGGAVPDFQDLGGDIDDAAAIGHEIGRVENAARVQAGAVAGGGQLVVGAAGHGGDPQGGDGVGVTDGLD